MLLITGKTLVAEQAKSADLAKSLGRAGGDRAVIVGAVALLVSVGAIGRGQTLTTTRRRRGASQRWSPAVSVVG